MEDTTYNSTETSDAVIQQGLDGILNWIAREALTGVIGIIAVLLVISVVVKLAKNAAASAKARAKERADEQMARIRHEQVLVERERIASNVKTRLKRVREENKLKTNGGDEAQIPIVTLKDMIDPIVNGVSIPIVSLSNLIEPIEIEGMEQKVPHVRNKKNQTKVSVAYHENADNTVF